MSVASRRLAVLTPWYPTPSSPFGGAFVRAQAQAVAPSFDRVDVYYAQEWIAWTSPGLQRVVWEAYRRLVTRHDAAPRPRRDGAAWARQIPVPFTPKYEFAQRARLHERAFRAALPQGALEDVVVHAHVAVPSGWCAVQLATGNTRVVVTEHASFLGQIFAQPEARRQYRQVIERADAFACVSGLVRDRIAEEFPDLAHRLRVVPNVVPVNRIPRRSRRVTSLRRWLYVGGLVERKGVFVLLEAFARAHDKHQDLTLTYVGHGNAQALESRAAELGLSEVVRVMPAVQPDEVFDLFEHHDLLVHASRYETFGLTVVEALAGGLPVLVTRCGGPEETLSGIEEIAGALVPVDDDPQVLVDGYEELVSRLDRLDPEAVRDELERRYGEDALRSRLADAYGLTTPAGSE